MAVYSVQYLLNDDVMKLYHFVIERISNEWETNHNDYCTVTVRQETVTIQLRHGTASFPRKSP